MRHYEIVFLVHPDQQEQVAGMIERYSRMVTTASGHVHRVENWGRRQLAYPMGKLHRAIYVLMNIEATHTVLAELEHGFRFNDAILRHLVVRLEKAETGPSPVMLEQEAGAEGSAGSPSPGAGANPSPGPEVGSNLSPPPSVATPSVASPTPVGA